MTIFSASGTFRQIFRRMKLSNGALKSSITERFFRFTQNGKQTYAKYRVGNTYIKTDLSDVAVLPNGTVRAQLTISAESTPLTVTRVELYNSDNALWAHQNCSITVNTGQTGILYWFDFTVTEQEVK